MDRGRDPLNTGRTPRLGARALVCALGGGLWTGCAAPDATALGGAQANAVPTDDGAAGSGPGTAPHTALDDRAYDYSDALRTASLKLLDSPPPLAQLRRVDEASDPEAAYRTELEAMLGERRFRARMVRWFRDVFRLGGTQLQDGAPTFAARVLAEERPFGELFTAASGTCPRYDESTDVFSDGDCDNGVGQHAGVLTNPGVMAQFAGNMAFRRVRWVQETFYCRKMPAELSEHPSQKGGGTYTSPWPFSSVSTTPIDFQDTSAVICANCHTTLNHAAPLFANFDARGQWKGSSQVMTPTAPEPTVTQLSHWLAPGETTAWRIDRPVVDLPALGMVLADDPDVHACMVARLWNFTMSKEDIVTDLSTVPESVIQPLVDELETSGSLKRVLQAMFESDDFVQF